MVGGGEHSLEHRESSFCSSNMPTMSKQQLHKAGVSIHQSRLEVGLSSQLGWNWKFLLRGQAALGRGDAGSHSDAGSPPSRSVKSNAVELGRCIVRGQRSGPCGSRHFRKATSANQQSRTVNRQEPLSRHLQRSGLH